MVANKQDKDSYFTWDLGGSPAIQKDEFEHLGQIWKTGSTSPDIGNRISKARRMSYALIGVGVHNSNGLDPVASLHITRTYILSRLSYGLEAAVLQTKDLDNLNKFYHTQLRVIQALPQNTSRVAVYLMLGALPFPALYDKQILTLFGSIARLQPTHGLHQLACRQLLQDNRHSWFTHSKATGRKYGIDICQEILTPRTKHQWKSLTDKSITNHFTTEMLEEAKQRATLCWIIW